MSQMLESFVELGAPDVAQRSQSLTPPQTTVLGPGNGIAFHGTNSWLGIEPHQLPEMSKEVQIKILSEKLDFTQKQLEEKDRQLEHYKQLVKTLKDVLSEVSSNRRFTQGRPPPGFEPPIPASKPNKTMRKAQSFHEGHVSNYDEFDEDEEIGFPQFRSPISPISPQPVDIDKTQLSWRRSSVDDQIALQQHLLPPSPVAGLISTPPATSLTNNNVLESLLGGTTAPAPMKGGAMPNTGNGSRIKKSVSHSAISSLAGSDNAPLPAIGNERRTAQGLSKSPPSVGTIGDKKKLITSVSTPSAPGIIPAVPSASAFQNANNDKKTHMKLKKSQSMTSVYTVLEENRLDLKFPDLDQMIGQIYALSKYQQGCRFLQKKLDDDIPTNTKIILDELLHHLVELMTDPFGNYLFSKLMEHCDSQQREHVIDSILPELLPTAFDMYGTQSMQKMMPYLTESQIEQVINALKPSAIALIKHNKANYLIQYCLDHLPQKHNQWIYDAVAESMEEVARDRVGCVIVKRCIDHATPPQKEALAKEISRKALALVQDPFGNYVVQHILEKCPEAECSQAIIQNLIGNITELCVQKFSSNVVEKCLQVANPENRRFLLQEIIDSDILPQLLNDRFANFVIQTALDVAEPEQRQLLVKNILPHLGRHYSPYTKRLQKKILQT